MNQPISGIYRITNLLDGREYIGQSKNIKRRFTDHLTPGHVSEHIDYDITKYGKENFKFEILEQCPVEELDDREAFYIDFYESDLLGYNRLRGGQGQGTRCGENNGNAKLTEDDVYAIREAYNNHEGREATYQKYKHIVAPDTFYSLWQGQYWKTVHMDVYTEENRRFYKGKIFTDKEVMDLRTRYSQGETIDSLYESCKDKCTKYGLKKAVFGPSYSYLPIYKKLANKWVYPEND